MPTQLKRHTLHRGTSIKKLEYYDPPEVDVIIRTLEVDADIWRNQSACIKNNADFWREKCRAIGTKLAFSEIRADYWKLKHKVDIKAVKQDAKKATTGAKVTVIAFTVFYLLVTLYLHSLGVL
jgi:hypothetical protein